MTRPTGSWNDIPRRLKRHFGTVHCTTPDDELLDQIFITTAVNYFSDERDFTDEVQQMVVSLVPLTRRLWHATKVSTHHLRHQHLPILLLLLLLLLLLTLILLLSTFLNREVNVS